MKMSEFKDAFGQAPDAWRNVRYGNGAELTLAIAESMLEAGEKEASKQQCPMSMAICDVGGNLIAFHRMENVMLAAIQISINKAYTAVMGKMTTANLGHPFRTGELIPLFFHERWITFNGGYPIVKDGKIIGGLGVSGGVVEDLYVAREMLRAGNFDLSAAEQSIKDFESGTPM
jgi:uncharacterized protein GlcG (DUF336 family)